MPKKRLKQNEKRRYENFLKKREMKKILKEITSSDKKQTEKLLPKAYKTIDKAAKTNVIKKNTASRKKSRITKLVNQKENAK